MSRTSLFFYAVYFTMNVIALSSILINRGLRYHTMEPIFAIFMHVSVEARTKRDILGLVLDIHLQPTGAVNAGCPL